MTCGGRTWVDVLGEPHLKTEVEIESRGILIAMIGKSMSIFVGKNEVLQFEGDPESEEETLVEEVGALAETGEAVVDGICKDVLDAEDPAMLSTTRGVNTRGGWKPQTLLESTTNLIKGIKTSGLPRRCAEKYAGFSASVNAWRPADVAYDRISLLERQVPSGVMGDQLNLQRKDWLCTGIGAV
ncbi:hypothetical protein BDN72DRAFT_865585 [Pluteus cervinus]|uniref:Uncharacterized protein n=1 Tax=Pluteus cervinus TaxID=181527 RepID=A0ACD3A020_9AGAR|nr:hypothetical protein BDN72DRAFT_865585 [Pluteus cervinus]